MRRGLQIQCVSTLRYRLWWPDLIPLNNFTDIVFNAEVVEDRERLLLKTKGVLWETLITR